MRHIGILVLGHHELCLSTPEKFRISLLCIFCEHSACYYQVILKTLHVQECKACHEAKPLTEYYRSVTNRDGLVSKCKRCMAQSNQRKVSVAIIAYLGSSALKLSNSSPTHE